MLLGYNTNGLVHHRLADAIDLVADIGYRAIAITLDHHCLDPFSADIDRQCETVRKQLELRKLTPVVETGARFVLDPRRKHWPTLVSGNQDDRDVRHDFVMRSIAIAERLGSQVVSLWSGVIEDGAPRDKLLLRLAHELLPLLDEAAVRDVQLALEPEPGMLIAAIDDFAELDELLKSQDIDNSHLKITADIGHMHCQRETPIADRMRHWKSRIVNVHIEDMPDNEHDHRLFGEGTIDFPPIMDALNGLADNTPVCVELSRHSHMGPEAAQQSFEFLDRLSIARVSDS